MISDFLQNHFDQIVDYGFTADVEQEFDQIATGALARNTMLERFYAPFHKLIEGSGGIDRSEVAQARFGPMLQLGSLEDKEDKPKFAPLPEGTRLETVTLEEALYAFKLPREVGKTPEGEVIKANIGRFGPYIQIGKLFVSIKEKHF